MQTRDAIFDPALARLLRGSFAKELRRSIEAYMRRCGMSASAFGLAAVGDAAFVSRRLRRGRRVKLDTADRVRLFLGEQAFRPVLLYEMEAFLAVSGIAGWIAGEQAVRQRSFISRLRSGASPLLRTIDRFRRWMRRHLRPAQRDAAMAAVCRALVRDPGCGRDAPVRRGESAEEGECAKRPDC